MYYSEGGTWNPQTKSIQWIGGPGTCCSNPATYGLMTYTEASNLWSISDAPFA